jgi:ribonuclease HI
MMIICTDGGVYDNKIVKWAWVCFDKDKMIASNFGDLGGGGQHNYDVERAESEAILSACQWAKKYVDENGKGNFELHTDSRAVIEKIRRKSSLHTSNNRIPGIISILEWFKGYQGPASLTIKWVRRRSDKMMEMVDDLCEDKK